jgi:XTP/dITP diphosphohydrolase
MVFIRHYLDPEPLITEGIWAGEILKNPRGANGFGYDPIFLDYKTEKSSAELEFDIKNRISHRAQALQKLTHKLKMIYD